MTGLWGSPGGEEPDSPSRRRLLRNLGLTVGSASLAGCADRDIELGPDVTDDVTLRPITVTGTAETRTEPDRAIMEIDVIEAPSLQVVDTETQQELARECRFALDGERYELVDSQSQNTQSPSETGESQNTQSPSETGEVVTDEGQPTQRERLAVRLDNVRSALKDELSDTDDLNTSRFALDKADRNRAVHSLLVDTQELSSVAGIAETALEAGAGRINRVVFTLSPNKRAQIHGDTLPDALDNAKIKAEGVAEAEDSVLVRRTSIDATDSRDRIGIIRQRDPESEEEVSDPNPLGKPVRIPEPTTDIAPVDSVSANMIDFEPGPITYALDIDVKYQMVPKDKVEELRENASAVSENSSTEG